MPYPTLFGTIADAQTLGPMGIPLYASPTALAGDTTYMVVGTIVATVNPPLMLQAVGTVPTSYVCKSVSSSQYAQGATTLYWVPFQAPDASGQNAPFFVRASCLALAAYSAGSSGTGTLTANANGAFAAVDGVTVAVGDQIFVPPGLTNVTAKDSGPWTIVSLGGASSKYVLTRPWWFFTGNQVSPGAEIKSGTEGTFMPGVTWKATAAKGTVIDTTDPAFYVKSFTFQRKLVAGTLALAAGQPTLLATSATCPVGIFSQSQSTGSAILAIANGTLTGTVSYGITNASSTNAFTTLGYVGTSAMAVFALATAQATQTSDTSTLNVTVTNFPE